MDSRHGLFGWAIDLRTSGMQDLVDGARLRWKRRITGTTQKSLSLNVGILECHHIKDGTCQEMF